MIEGFAGLPRASLVARLKLQVAAREIVADGVAVDMIKRGSGGYAFPGTTDGDDHFNLVMQIVREARVGDLRAIADDGIGWLLKEERRFAGGVLAHFTGMLGVVAADAMDAPDRKSLCGVRYRNRGRRRWRECIVSHDAVPCERPNVS